MQVVTPDFIRNKKVLLRLDLDVPLEVGAYGNTPVQIVKDDFRLKAGIQTLKICLEYASEVIVMGHLGRPGGKDDPELSVEPIYDWLMKELGEQDKLKLLENLRFEPGEEACDLGYAQELASFGEVYVNEAFAAYHPAASTTVLPTLLPHAAGLRFAKEVVVLTRVKEAPRRPFVVIIGGAKIEDKLPAVEAMAKVADYVLVGGKIALQGGPNVLVAKLNDDGTDIANDTLSEWQKVITQAAMIVWNGPVGKIEDPKNDQTRHLAEVIVESGAETVIGGGDTVGFLGKLGMLDKFSFISTGGGAMLKFLEQGTLPTIEALK